MQQHLPSFERMWTDADSGNCLPKFVTEELQKFLTCGILACGFAQMHCDACCKRLLVAFSCKGRGFCPSCIGRRMNEGAANLVDHVLPEGVPIRQWVLTLPYPLRYPLAFDGHHLSKVHRIFTDTVSAWYRRNHPEGKTGAVTVIQRASSDLRLNPHFHTLFLDGVYLPSQAGNASDSVASDGKAPTFTAAPTPSQEDVESVVQRARKRILRYLEKRGVVTFAPAPGDGEVNAVLDETLGETSPALAGLLASATAGVAPAGPAQRSTPVRLLASTDARPEPKGYLCAQDCAFNLHAARRVAPNDKQGREMLCRYILRPPMANERLHLLADGHVELEFKRPWKDGTRSIGLAPKAFLARLSAIVPPPRRHITLYCGVLSSHSQWRKHILPRLKEEPEESAQQNGIQELVPKLTPDAENKPKAAARRRYIPWYELLRRTFGSEVLCPACDGKLRLIALVKKEETIRKILAAMHYPTGPPNVSPAQSPVSEEKELEFIGGRVDEEWLD